MSRNVLGAMPAEAFERLSKQLAMISGGCSDDQLLELADILHDLIRHRREVGQGRSFAPSERVIRL